MAKKLVSPSLWNILFKKRQKKEQRKSQTMKVEGKIKKKMFVGLENNLHFHVCCEFRLVSLLHIDLKPQDAGRETAGDHFPGRDDL